MTSRRPERKHRQTYPGPNAADNQQMLQDIKDSITSSHRGREGSNGSSGHSTSAGSEKEMKGERQPETWDVSTEQRRSPQTERPTKQFHSDKNRQHLRDIRQSLRPFFKSDGNEKVNKHMLEQLISLGLKEVSN